MEEIMTVFFVILAVVFGVLALGATTSGKCLILWVLTTIFSLFAAFSFQNPNTVQSVATNVANTVEQKTNQVISNPAPSEASAVVVVPGTVPDCYSINGDWEKAFANNQIYQVKPGTGGLPTGEFVFFEGVLVDSQPKDLHSVFEIKTDFTAEQGNFWACGSITSDEVKNTILFQSADKKWQNLDSQGLAHPIEVTTSDGKKHSFESGQKPDWYLDADETAMVCPYTDKPYRQDPAGVIQPDGTFVGAPGKAGCDFVAIGPDGQALRYTGAQDNFVFEAGTRFFLFDQSWSNEDLATELNIAKIKNYSK